MTANILILCTYPIAKPLHGGQLRVSNIVSAYENFGCKVEVAGVLGSREYPKEIGFCPFPESEDLSSVMSNSFLMEDYAISRIFGMKGVYYSNLKSLIKSNPDIIHVEQPWLFPFATRFADECTVRPKIIYGSQNIEHRLKRDIVESYMGKEAGVEAEQLVLQCELDALRAADASVGVSENDVQWMQSESSGRICLAPNGVKPWISSLESRREARMSIGDAQYALYCASAHPPNMTGFFEMFGGGFGSLNPRQRLVVAGGAGTAILQDPRVHESAKLYERLIALGVVSQSCLSGLLDEAHCIVLPLTQGGGTNLKTAEALWAGKYVLATTVAMRGFEKYSNAKGIFICDEPSAFKRALREIMQAPDLNLSDAERDLRKDVLWEHSIANLPKFANQLLTC